jgi:membrane protein
MQLPRLPARLQRAVDIVSATFTRFSDASGPSKGAAVAFYAAFSMAPLLVVLTQTMVWLLGDASARETLLQTLRELVGPSESETLARFIQSAPPMRVDHFSNLGTWAAIGSTMVGATGVFVELRAALQAMLGEQPLRGFDWWALVRVRLLAIGIVVGSAFLLSVALVVQTAALVALGWASHRWPLLAPLLGVAEGLWSWGVIGLLFALIIRFLPDLRLPMRQALWGGLAAGLLFMLGRYAISLYIAHSATQSALGAAGSFAALLVWVYWSCQIFLLGAALAVELGREQAQVPEGLAPAAPAAPAAAG